MQCFDWDRYDAEAAEQGDEAEAAEQGARARRAPSRRARRRAVWRGMKSVSEYSRLWCLVLR